MYLMLVLESEEIQPDFDEEEDDDVDQDLNKESAVVGDDGNAVDEENDQDYDKFMSHYD